MAERERTHWIDDDCPGGHRPERQEKPTEQDIEAAKRLGHEIAELADSVLSSEGDPDAYAKEIADLSAAVTGILVSRFATACAEGERKGREAAMDIDALGRWALAGAEAQCKAAEQRGREERCCGPEDLLRFTRERIMHNHGHGVVCGSCEITKRIDSYFAALILEEPKA